MITSQEANMIAASNVWAAASKEARHALIKEPDSTLAIHLRADMKTARQQLICEWCRGMFSNINRYVSHELVRINRSRCGLDQCDKHPACTQPDMKESS